MKKVAAGISVALNSVGLALSLAGGALIPGVGYSTYFAVLAVANGYFVYKNFMILTEVESGTGNDKAQ